MKKHLFVLVLFLVWNTLNISAQNGVSIRISHQTDSTLCRSVVGSQLFTVIYQFAPEIEDSVTSRTKWICPEIQMNGSGWKRSRCEILPSDKRRIISETTTMFASYLDYFTDKDSLGLSPVNGKVLAEIRVKASLDIGQSFGTYYSNIDTIYLDAPTDADKNAFKYLVAHKDTLDYNTFAWARLSGDQVPEYAMKALVDQYPESAIADHARYCLWKRFSDINPAPTDIVAYMLHEYHHLATSPSAIIRWKAEKIYKYEVKKFVE